MFQISRRKFFGLFGGAVAVTAIPKPLMAMAAPEAAPVTATFTLTDAWGIRKGNTYAYVQFLGDKPMSGFRPGATVYWCDPSKRTISLNSMGRNRVMRYAAGVMVGPIEKGRWGSNWVS